MLLFIGLLSILQSTILPGLLIYKLLFKEVYFLRALPFIFALSLTTNWILIYYFSLINIYSKNFLLIILITELIAILKLFKFKKISKNSFNFRFSIKSFYKILFVFILISTLIIFLLKIGNIFTAYDAVVSWNNWAQIWTDGEIARNTEFYPQLLPVNYSISYVLLGQNSQSLQFFAYFIALLFIPITLALPFTMYRYFPETRIDAIFFVFLIFLGWPTFRPNLGSIGYADMPVMVLSLISLCAFIMGLYELRRINAEKNISLSLKLFFISTFIASGAAATKQAGIFYAIINFISIFIILIKYRKKFTKYLPYIPILFFLTHIAIYLIWYINAYIFVKIGVNSSLIQYHTEEIHHGLSYGNRFILAAKNFPSKFMMFALALPSILVNKYRYFAIIGIIYFLIWSIFFSYDERNLSVGLPFLAIGSSYIIYSFMKKFKFEFKKICLKININFPLLIIFFIFSLGVLSTIFTNKYLLENNEAKQKLLMRKDISEAIYQNFNKFGPKKIITSQQNFVARLPKMPYQVVIPYEFEDNSIQNIKYFEYLIKNNSGNYILIDKRNKNMNPSTDVNNMIEKLIRDRIIEIVYDHNDVKMFLIKK